MKVNKIKKINFPRFVILLLALAVVIVATGFTYSFFVLQPQKEIAQVEAERVKADLEAKNETQKKLDDCLQKAKDSFNRRFEINSVPDPREGHPDARTWNNDNIMETVLEEYKEDRDFCIKLYK